MSMGLLILAGDRAVYCMCYSASDLQFAYGKGSSSSISAHAHVRGSHALDLPHHNMRKISRNNVSNSVSIHQIYNRECQHSVGTYARGTPICSHITCHTGLRGVCYDHVYPRHQKDSPNFPCHVSLRAALLHCAPL